MRAHTEMCSLLVVVLSFGFVVANVVEQNDVFGLDEESFETFLKPRDLVIHSNCFLFFIFKFTQI